MVFYALGKSLVDQRKRGIKKTLLVDRRGAPLIASTNIRRNKKKRRIYPRHRLIIERTFGWFAWLRGLKMCWCKTKIAYQSLF
jgi:hypothetical protein